MEQDEEDDVRGVLPSEKEEKKLENIILLLLLGSKSLADQPAKELIDDDESNPIVRFRAK